MSIHNFTRDLVNGVYNINNPERVDEEGEQIYLYMDLDTIPEFTHKFNIKCYLGDCDITFNFDLDASQISTLNTLVSNHKNNI